MILRNRGYSLHFEGDCAIAVDYRIVWMYVVQREEVLLTNELYRYWESLPNRPPRSPCIDICEMTVRYSILGDDMH